MTQQQLLKIVKYILEKHKSIYLLNHKISIL